MSDDVISYAGVRGEKVSIASPYGGPSEISDRGAASLDLLRRIAEHGAPPLVGALSLCGALALWSAPAVLLSQYAPKQLLDGLFRVSVNPTTSDLVTLSALLLYFVTTGLLLGAATAPLLPRLRALRFLLRLAVAPLVGLSLGATLLVAVPLFLGTLIKCFPDLV